PLFQSKVLAVLCNVGTLTAPTTKTQYQAGTRPYQLFSHSDQQAQWQTSSSASNSPSGWGGRMSDATEDAAVGFPPLCSVSGVPVVSVGSLTRSITLSPAPTTLNQSLRVVQPDANIAPILTIDRSPASPMLVNASASITQSALNNSALLNTNPTLTTAFPNTGLGNQLLQVAKLISLSANLGLKRQIFFCSLGGFDTHTVQLSTQMNLLQQPGEGMPASHRATVDPAVSGSVTSFTLSDFNRTYKPAGTAAATVGSDHAWGSHQFIMGDSVAGGDFYGAFPDLV